MGCENYNYEFLKIISDTFQMYKVLYYISVWYKKTKKELFVTQEGLKKEK